GELLVTGSGTNLLLKNDTLDDYKSTTPGKIQVATGATLELQTTIIDGGTGVAGVTGATFNIDGALTADGSVSSTIENFAAGNFTNDGELLVTGSGTNLLLKNDTLDDYKSTTPGKIQVATGATLELQTTIIDGGTGVAGVTGATFNIAGTIPAASALRSPTATF